MIPLNHLPDDQIANVLTYVQNSWGNSGDVVTAEQVRRIRAELPAPATTSSKFE
jgi:nitrite reductase (NO-forming)